MLQFVLCESSILCRLLFAHISCLCLATNSSHQQWSRWHMSWCSCFTLSTVCYLLQPLLLLAFAAWASVVGPVKPVGQMPECPYFYVDITLYLYWKERKGRVFIYRYFSRHTHKALGHGSHSFTCKLHHVCLAFVSIHQMSDWRSRHLIAAYYTLIDLERMKGWVGLVGWPIADGLPT